MRGCLRFRRWTRTRLRLGGEGHSPERSEGAARRVRDGGCRKAGRADFLRLPGGTKRESVAGDAAAQADGCAGRVDRGAARDETGELGEPADGTCRWGPDHGERA